MTQSENQSHRALQSARHKPLVAKYQTITTNNMPILNEAISLMRSIQSKRQNTERDEYSVFGEQVAIKVRKLKSPHAKFMIQSVINSALFEAEMGKYDSFPVPKFQSPTPNYNFVPPLPNVNTYYSRFQLPVNISCPPTNIHLASHSSSPSTHSDVYTISDVSSQDNIVLSNK
ncbi:hypothetical protein MML48_5g00012963 [Holotrichia oblita]|uniref:Uncharacterized protein n=1 Tax=Holotrichia oblita TaxID=644536 RepID=A0ACB9T260_HOLOL|nr:hypothetical protein MML48_5g00012963 [Holotrichia oblita]